MKFSRITWLILGVGIFAVGAVGIYLIYQEEIEAQDLLNESIAATEATLPQIIAQKSDLEGQLAQLEDDLAQAEAGFEEAVAKWPESIQSIYYGDLLFYWAETLDLRVTSFTSSEPTAMLEDGISYEVTNFTVTVEADLAKDILRYLTLIELDDDFRTARIDSVTTVIVDPEDEEATEITSADISLTITKLKS